ncbi:MAG: hypothetical protein MJ087_04795 [Lachnospiraceae bacterium]|nr:hypothetical protein [Lachnospiraceae bacterium]
MSRLIDENLMIEIAKLYYENNLTQAQIATKLSISRSLISKTQKKKKNMGIVEVIIHSEVIRPHKDLEDLLKQLLGMRHVRICDIPVSGEIENALAQEANTLLKPRLSSAKTVVVCGGQTIRAMANSFSSELEYPNLTFVPASGGLGECFWDSDPNHHVATFASKCGAQQAQLYAPVFVDSVEAKEILTRQYFLKNVLERAKQADIALVGIGKPFSAVALLEHQPPNILEDLTQKKAQICGDINFNCFDNDGNTLACRWNQQIIGLSLEEIKNIPTVICIASGTDKIVPIITGAKNHFFNSLVIDLTLAKKLYHYYYKKPF